MGAGAGCTIEVKDCSVIDVGSISLQTADIYTDSWNCTLRLDCNVKVSGTVNISSYDYGSGDVEEVAFTVKSVSMDLGIGNGYNHEILTDEAIDRFEEQFDGDIEDIWEKFLPELTVDDLEIGYIMDQLSSGYNYAGSGAFGSGWVGVTFDGEFEIDDVDSHSGYNQIEEYTASIDEDFVIDYLDKAKYGDNIEYTAFYNGDILDSYNDLDEAIDALKSEILKDISAADLPECYVERHFYYLNNGSVDNYEYASDWDFEVEYCADSDSDFDFEALADISSELDEENDVDIDEGFDI